MARGITIKRTGIRNLKKRKVFSHIMKKERHKHASRTWRSGNRVVCVIFERLAKKS